MSECDHVGRNRRAEDKRWIERIARSPWAILGSMATTGLLTVAVGSAFLSGYGTVQENARMATHNTKSLESLEGTVGNMKSDLLTVKSNTKQNTQDIKRVEQQARRDRREIIRRLERLDSKLNSISRFLRGGRDTSLALPAYINGGSNDG